MKASEARDITDLINSQIETRILNEERTFLDSIYTKIKVAAGKGKTHIYFSVKEEYVDNYNISNIVMFSPIFECLIDRIMTELKNNGYKTEYDDYYYMTVKWY